MWIKIISIIFLGLLVYKAIDFDPQLELQIGNRIILVNRITGDYNCYVKNSLGDYETLSCKY